ncbi:flagellar basal body rod protein FlgB [Planctomycetota bacterium]
MHPTTSFNKGALPTLRSTIQFTQRRSILIANNIANVETPMYQAKDISEGDFKELLGRAVDKRRDGNPRIWKFKGNRNMRPRAGGGMNYKILPAGDVDIQQHDQNNVDIDKEMVKLAKNTILHNTMVELLTKQYNLIESAISERV